VLTSLYFGILIGLLLFNLFLHIQIAARSRWSRREIFLLVGIAGALIYSAATYAEYRSSDLDFYFRVLRLQMFCEPLFFASILELCVSASGKKRPRGLLAFEAGFFLFVLIRFFLPYTGIYVDPVGMVGIDLPWGDTIFLVRGRPTPLMVAYFLFVLTALGMGAMILLRMLRSGARREASLLLAAVGLILFGIGFDFSVALGLVRWFYMTEFTYVAMTIVVSLEVTAEVIKFSELKTELERSLAEKDVLLKEIHHRVKNNLQIISSLLSLQAEGSDLEESKAALAESGERVRSISLVHEQLYSSASLADIDLAEYAVVLMSGIRNSHGLDDRRVICESRVDNLRIDIGLAVPFGLILNELVTNSMKHGLQGKKLLRIVFEAERKGNRIAFEYSDDGPGFPEGFDPDCEGNLGLTLIRTLTGQIKATGGFLHDRPGLSFRIELPG
jgi:two-component sensor histidine kinase